MNKNFENLPQGVTTKAKEFELENMKKFTEAKGILKDIRKISNDLGITKDTIINLKTKCSDSETRTISVVFEDLKFSVCENKNNNEIEMELNLKEIEALIKMLQQLKKENIGDKSNTFYTTSGVSESISDSVSPSYIVGSAINQHQYNAITEERIREIVSDELYKRNQYFYGQHQHI